MKDVINRRRFYSKETELKGLEIDESNFKTEICKNFQFLGNCKYGSICRFAHGRQELRGKEKTSNKYKTK